MNEKLFSQELRKAELVNNEAAGNSCTSTRASLELVPRVHCDNDNVHYANYVLLPLGFQPNILFLSTIFQIKSKNK